MDGELGHDVGPQNEEIPVEGLIPENNEHVPLLTWENLWQLIVHRDAGIIEDPGPAYEEDVWTLDPGEPPFPFGLEETWYCAALITLVLTATAEIDTEWLFQRGYRQYLTRVSSRILLTVAISIFSTLSFEVVGNVLDQFRELIHLEVRLIIDSWLIVYLDWGHVDLDALALGEDPIQFHHGHFYLHEPIRESLRGLAALLYNCSFALYLYLALRAIRSGFIGLVGIVSPDLSFFLYNLHESLALPLPSTDRASSLLSLFGEFVIPASFQVCVAAFTYLCVFLFMSRAETPAILGQGGQDPFSKLAFQLLRAVAMHLLAYTAYQLFCICVAASPGFWLFGNVLKSQNHWLIRRGFVHFAPGAGALVLGFHWLVKRACKLCVDICFSLWIPYIVWLSLKTETSTRDNWEIYGTKTLGGDMSVFNPDTRVFGRAAMTALCGLHSSWPARMRLSSVDGVD
ncbi:hypothetical protein F4677DRAFT_460112 [Hypoxylon crocopeplum]|nr:hypothetical protein F4677DRAFT_460112 [Hypoxylon crocopeplum]